MITKCENPVPVSQYAFSIAIWLTGLLLCSSHLYAYNVTAPTNTQERLDQLLENLHAPTPALTDEGSKQPDFINQSIRVNGCEDYPHHDNQGKPAGLVPLVKDLKSGLKQGLMCIMGKGPVGPLHIYHFNQGLQLMSVLEDEDPKAVQCVQDELFAYAIAKTPSHDANTDRLLAERFVDMPALSILLDTYRLGGLLSRKFESETYRDFFKLNNQQISRHLMGKPIHVEGMHRYQNMPALLFHEMVHWLGHVHTNLHPDITFLYEACCFGGSDYISDKATNKAFQEKACSILKDDELWSLSHYGKMSLWRSKKYDQLKADMRSHYQ